MAFAIEKIRDEFPALKLKVYGKPLVYFDNAATTQKPQVVIDTITDFYSNRNSNIHRGVHFLSEKATEAYENARKTVQKFINAKKSNEIIFTKGSTDGINLVAFSFGEQFVHEGDEVLISEMEHHSNIVPWQMLCIRKHAHLKVIPFDDKGVLLLDNLDSLISGKTRIIAISQISNSLGTINPVKEVIKKAKARNIPVLIDGAQAIQHLPVDVQALDCDFYVFSGHKIYAETGIGVLYGKEKWLDAIPPYQGGGDMIESVSFEETIFNKIPLKFEAGTNNIAGALSLAVAINYIQDIGLQEIGEYEKRLLVYATEKLLEIEGLKIYGTADEKAAIISFCLKGIHHYDAGMVLDKLGIALRTGTHCTEPVMKHFGITGTLRASFSFYNTKEEINNMVQAIQKTCEMFG